MTALNPRSLPRGEPDGPEDVLFDSLHTLYEYQPITLTSAGATYTHRYTLADITTTITLQTPDPEAANWALHASSVWVASAQLAFRLEYLRLDEHLRRVRLESDRTKIERRVRVLELGAGAGLPSILIAKLFSNTSVLATDYPDEKLTHTLTQNVERNGVQRNCRVAAYAWGTDTSALFSDLPCTSNSHQEGFDVIIAADTLWNPELHGIFINTLERTLLKVPGARVHLVVGLHTGRYTIDSFLRAVQRAGFRIVDVLEREVVANGDYSNSDVRSWDVTRAEFEEEKDRRRWVIWIELSWEEDRLQIQSCTNI